MLAVAFDALSRDGHALEDALNGRNRLAIQPGTGHVFHARANRDKATWNADDRRAIGPHIDWEEYRLAIAADDTMESRWRRVWTTAAAVANGNEMIHPEVCQCQILVGLSNAAIR